MTGAYGAESIATIRRTLEIGVTMLTPGEVAGTPPSPYDANIEL